MLLRLLWLGCIILPWWVVSLRGDVFERGNLIDQADKTHCVSPHVCDCGQLLIWKETGAGPERDEQHPPLTPNEDYLAKQHLPGPLCKGQYALAFDNAYEDIFAERNPDRD